MCLRACLFALHVEMRVFPRRPEEGAPARRQHSSVCCSECIVYKSVQSLFSWRAVLAARVAICLLIKASEAIIAQ